VTVTELLKDPVAVLIGGLTSLWALLQIPLVHSFGLALWASANEIFTFLSLAALTLPPHIPPETAIDWVILAAGALFLAKVGAVIWGNFDRRF
jgi:predicted membrane-bound dolichyl-phosphate-mannose-protein mannosyltransferase